MKANLVKLGLFIVFGGAVVLLILNRQPRPGAGPDKNAPAVSLLSHPAPVLEASKETPAPGATPLSVVVLSESNNAPVKAEKQVVDAGTKLPMPSVPSPSPVRRVKELQDPLARAALQLVGIDPAAEQYWLEAIFDASLPAKEREDLMEDLNEEGFADPRHPGPEDFPLILARLRIIERVVLDADEEMWPHLAEAYKDLSNMLNGGAPQ